MATLDHWRRLTECPSTIECSSMRLLSSWGHEHPIFTGPGYRIRSTTDIDFTIYATPTNAAEAWRRLSDARAHPYDIHAQLRLEATGYDGTRWHCGWTSVDLKGAPRTGCPLHGFLGQLQT